MTSDEIQELRIVILNRSEKSQKLFDYLISILASKANFSKEDALNHVYGSGDPNQKKEGNLRRLLSSLNDEVDHFIAKSEIEKSMISRSSMLDYFRMEGYTKRGLSDLFLAQIDKAISSSSNSLEHSYSFQLLLTRMNFLVSNQKATDKAGAESLRKLAKEALESLKHDFIQNFYRLEKVRAYSEVMFTSKLTKLRTQESEQRSDKTRSRDL